jgi:DNA-3-methyladenine glycosylase II
VTAPSPVVATRDGLATAAAELARRSPSLRRVVEVVGPPDFGWRARRRRTHFAELARAICFQQLAGAAARAIHGRFEALYSGAPTAATVLATSDEALRGAGLSGAKIAALRDLAAKVEGGAVSLARIGARPDDAVVAELTQVRGIGRWTAEMFLIFQLRRLDVWPVDDLGVRVGYARMHRLPATPPARELEPLGEQFRPYRSVAAWYCWRAAEPSALL